MDVLLQFYCLGFKNHADAKVMILWAPVLSLCLVCLVLNEQLTSTFWSRGLEKGALLIHLFMFSDFQWEEEKGP